MNNVVNVIMRIVAVIAAEALGVIGAGALVGIDTWKSCMLAGGLGAATVLEALARSFLDDGKLSTAEINAAFATVDKKKSKE
jgi:hypothetical protein